MNGVAIQPFDPPTDASPVLSAFAMPLNDRLLDDASRSRWLDDIIPLIAGSSAPPEVEMRRALFLTDRAVRLFVPIALEFAGLPQWATRLRALIPLTDSATAKLALATIIRGCAKADRVMDRAIAKADDPARCGIGNDACDSDTYAWTTTTAASALREAKAAVVKATEWASPHDVACHAARSIDDVAWTVEDLIIIHTLAADINTMASDVLREACAIHT